MHQALRLNGTRSTIFHFNFAFDTTDDVSTAGVPTVAATSTYLLLSSTASIRTHRKDVNLRVKRDEILRGWLYGKITTVPRRTSCR